MRLFAVSKRETNHAHEDRKPREKTIQEAIAGLSPEELRSVQKTAAERIAALDARKESMVFKAVEALLAEHGVSTGRLIAHLQGKTRVRYLRAETSPRLYRHPKTGQTWVGRGRKPNWVKEFEAQGGRLQEIAVEVTRSE